MNRNERIKYLLEKRGISYDAVGDILKVGKAAVSNRLNRAKEIDDDEFINAVVFLTGYPQEMIITGEGFQELFFAEHSQVSETQAPYNKVLVENAVLKAENERLEKEVTWLRSLVERLPGAK